MSGPRVFEHCPICQDTQISSSFLNTHHVYKIDCRACGSYCLDGIVADLVSFDHPGTWWTYVRRQALAHKLKTQRDVPIWSDLKRPFVSMEVLSNFEQVGIFLPNRLEQMDNAVRYLAAAEISEGLVPNPLPWGLWAQVGTLNSVSLADLLEDMVREGLIPADLNIARGPHRMPLQIANARLSLGGWRRWGELREGETRSRDGFIAMKFGDERLDKFVRDVVQAGVRDSLERSVFRIDSLDRVEAGLIDNRMRDAIEDAAFVLVELSHANVGAYWEAGFAEGLGKPVIYLCEREAWDDPKTRPHFDVNHRTTVMWDHDQPEEFLKVLVATIKNSLREKAG